MSGVLDAAGLSPIQKRFCDEFLVDFNAKAAYERAGYRARGDSAAACAARLLARPAVSDYLKTRQRQLAEASNLTLERLVQELKAIALFDMRRLFKEDGSMLAPNEWPADVAAAVSSVDVDEITQKVNGQTVIVGCTRKVRVFNKIEALEKGFRLLVAYPEKKEVAPVAPVVGVVVVPAKTPWQDRHKPAIDVEARRIERTAPLPPKATEFKVKAG